MLLTHPAAHKKSLFSGDKFHEWRFVILGFNSPWIHLTQTILKKGEVIESKTLIVTEPSELFHMHENIHADVRYDEAYLITPAHVNRSWGCDQSLLKRIDRVVEHTKDHINVYHVYTVEHDRRLLSSAPLDRPDSRNITTLYQAPEQVLHRATQREVASKTRRLEILRASALMHDGDPELGFSWTFESLQEFEGIRPIDMTTDQLFEKFKAYFYNHSVNRSAPES